MRSMEQAAGQYSSRARNLDQPLGTALPSPPRLGTSCQRVPALCPCELPEPFRWLGWGNSPEGHHDEWDRAERELQPLAHSLPADAILGGVGEPDDDGPPHHSVLGHRICGVAVHRIVAVVPQKASDLAPTTPEGPEGLSLGGSSATCCGLVVTSAGYSRYRRSSGFRR
jgi:hypothetical protein